MNEESEDFADKLNVYFASRHYPDRHMRRSPELYWNIIVFKGRGASALCSRLISLTLKPARERERQKLRVTSVLKTGTSVWRMEVIQDRINAHLPGCS
jgi:hypothetical protein